MRHSQVACALSILETSHETRGPRIEVHRIGSLFGERGVNASSNDLCQGDAFPPCDSSQTTLQLSNRSPSGIDRAAGLRLASNRKYGWLDMGSHMKTTVDISDAVFFRAKKLAAEQHQTLKAIIDSALRQYLDSASPVGNARFRLRKHPFKGHGLQPGLDESDWTAIRDRAYEGRGG